MFRNLTLFQFSDAVAKRLFKTLADDVANYPAREPGPLELSTCGFVSPAGGNHHLVMNPTYDARFLRVAFDDKLLPSSVITKELYAREQKILATEGRRISRRESKRLREEILTDLLPRAFVRRRVVDVYFDLQGGWIAVDTASRRLAEQVITKLREALGSFPAAPLAPEESPRALLTDWISTGNVPKSFVVGDECELREPVEQGAKWQAKRADLETDEAREHLKAGAQVFRLGLYFKDRLGFILDEDMSIRKLQLLDAVMDEIYSQNYEEVFQELVATQAMLDGEFRALFQMLADTFGLVRPVAKEGA